MATEAIKRNETPIWRQLATEPDAAYFRFLYYRNLGRVRSINRAFRVAMKEAGKEVAINAIANGLWNADSKRWEWVRRCDAWDRDIVATAGHDATVGLIYAIKACTEKLNRALRRSKGPLKWQSVLETINVLASLTDPETVKAALDAGRVDPLGQPVQPKAQEAIGVSD